MILIWTHTIAFVSGVGVVWLVRRGVSAESAGIFVGVVGTLCIAAIALAIRNVRRGEAKRKAQEEIWIKH